MEQVGPSRGGPVPLWSRLTERWRKPAAAPPATEVEDAVAAALGLDADDPQGLANAVAALLPQAAPAPRPAPRPTPRVAAVSSADLFEPVWRRLLREEVTPEVAERIVARAREILPPERRHDPRDALLAATGAMADLLPVTGPLKVRRDQCTVLALVGPTGVGKSTTLAKVAAIAALKEHRTVAIITTDTYRVAATEQVKTYGRLLKIPVTVARGAEELVSALNRHRFRDLILLDTAGQSPNDAHRLADLGDLIGGAPEIKRCLVLSATTKTADVRTIIERFGRLGLDGLLFTKLDESASHGVILDAALASGLPLTWFSTGQGVPQDIEVASVARVASLLLPLDRA